MNLSPREVQKLHSATHALMGLEPCDCWDCQEVQNTRQAIALRSVIQAIMEEKNHAERD